MQIALFCEDQTLMAMSTKMIVDDRNGLKEIVINEQQQPPATRIAANIISYLFHPVFVPVYVMLFLLYEHPYIFAGVSARDKILTLLQSVLMYTFFPLVTVLLLKGLGFIPSILLRTQRERIIPLLATMTWSFWIWNVWRNLPGSPREIVLFSMAAFLASIVAWLMNIYVKVSLHAIAMGVAASFFLTLAFSSSLSFGIYISIVLALTGLVCTARLLVSDHRPAEVYSGLLGGVVATLVAGFFS